MSAHPQKTEPQSVGHNDEVQPSEQIDLTETLTDAIKHLLSQQGYPVDNIRLHDVAERHSEQSDLGWGVIDSQTPQKTGILDKQISKYTCVLMSCHWCCVFA